MLAVFRVMSSAWPICRLVRPAATLPSPGLLLASPSDAPGVERRENVSARQGECQ
jgi:hypothetical protein